MKRFLNERGAIVFFIWFIVICIVLLMLFAFAIPFIVDFNTKIYEAGESLLQDANATAQNFSDPDIRAQFTDAISAAADSIPTQTLVLTSFFQYGYILVIVIAVIIMYMLTRQSVEATGGIG